MSGLTGLVWLLGGGGGDRQEGGQDVDLRRDPQRRRDASRSSTRGRHHHGPAGGRHPSRCSEPSWPLVGRGADAARDLCSAVGVLRGSGVARVLLTRDPLVDCDRSLFGLFFTVSSLYRVRTAAGGDHRRAGARAAVRGRCERLVRRTRPSCSTPRSRLRSGSEFMELTSSAPGRRRRAGRAPRRGRRPACRTPTDQGPAGLDVVVEHLVGDRHDAGAVGQRRQNSTPSVQPSAGDVGGGEVGALRRARRTRPSRSPAQSRSRLPCRSRAAREGCPGAREAWATAGWSGAPEVKVRNCLAVSTARTRWAGPVAQPTFQPVKREGLPGAGMVSVRSRMPGRVASGRCSAASERQVLVDLVGDDHQVVLDRELGDGRELGVGEHRAGRVVRAVEQQQPGAAGDRRAQLVDVQAEVGRAQGDRPPNAARHLDAGDVGVVEGLERDDLVAGSTRPSRAAAIASVQPVVTTTSRSGSSSMP